MIHYSTRDSHLGYDSKYSMEEQCFYFQNKSVLTLVVKDEE